MTADYPLLRRIIEAELASGGRDMSIEGGLDALLAVQAHDEHPHSPLLRMIVALPQAGYASLGAEERETWLRRARATVLRELALEEHLEPVRPDAIGGRPRSGRGATTSRGKKPKSPPASDARRPATGSGRTGASSSSSSAASSASSSSSASKAIPPGAAGLDAPIEKAATGL